MHINSLIHLCTSTSALNIYMLPNVEILNVYGHEKQLKCWHRRNVSNVSRVDAATKEIGTKSVKLWRRYIYLLTTININTVTALGLEVYRFPCLLTRIGNMFEDK